LPSLVIQSFKELVKLATLQGVSSLETLDSEDSCG
jgi:hypothetical protein